MGMTGFSSEWSCASANWRDELAARSWSVTAAFGLMGFRQWPVSPIRWVRLLDGLLWTTQQQVPVVVASRVHRRTMATYAYRFRRRPREGRRDRQALGRQSAGLSNRGRLCKAQG